mmetsp:Transcript_119937/g.235714  ORF Transcript_119937/g.235714 Transcript_119937/m.235714 type:complete len:272 (-) Transcript_119937:668-1483(-)
MAMLTMGPLSLLKPQAANVCRRRWRDSDGCREFGTAPTKCPRTRHTQPKVRAPSASPHHAHASATLVSGACFRKSGCDEFFRIRPLGKSLERGSGIFGSFPEEADKYCEDLPRTMSGGLIATFAPAEALDGQEHGGPGTGCGLLYPVMSTPSWESHDAHLPTNDLLANVANASLSCLSPAAAAATAACRKAFWTSFKSAFCCSASNILECNASSQFLTSFRKPSTASDKLFFPDAAGVSTGDTSATHAGVAGPAAGRFPQASSREMRAARS